MKSSKTAVVLALLACLCTSAHAAEQARWWPKQTLPAGVVRTMDGQTFPEPQLAYHMLVQSVAGLAAQAVNEHRGDELVWVASSNADLERWYQKTLDEHDNIQPRGELSPWALVDRFAKRGIIRGYILYRADKSQGSRNDRRKGIDCSVNVATSLAGLLGGVIVEEGLEAEAKQHGLTLLLDARDKTQAWCFATYKDRFNNHLLFTQDPRKPHARDLAIAQRALTIFGDEQPLADAMAWLAPLSPILGWNGGDEFETTRLSTEWGHLQTATDWCMNLPVLMAGSHERAPRVIPPFDATKIDWNDRRSGVSFVMSDGDNVQWMETNFFSSPDYWGNPQRGRTTIGWSCCFAHLRQLCPVAIDYAADFRTDRDSLVEWGGGYYYPDLFATKRPNPKELFAEQSRRTWALMRGQTEIIAWNVSEPFSPAAIEAYQTFAHETDGLLAILVFQYSAYEGAAGKTVWVKDRNGVEVPVISARYSLWEHANQRARAGTPAKVAREIRETVEKIPQGGTPRYDWAVAHAWSRFRLSKTLDEDAENLRDPQGAGSERGFETVAWCVDRLGDNVRVLKPEELAWRVRMAHNPEQTKAALRQVRH